MKFGCHTRRKWRTNQTKQNNWTLREPTHSIKHPPPPKVQLLMLHSVTHANNQQLHDFHEPSIHTQDLIRKTETLSHQISKMPNPEQKQSRTNHHQHPDQPNSRNPETKNQRKQHLVTQDGHFIRRSNPPWPQFSIFYFFHTHEMSPDMEVHVHACMCLVIIQCTVQPRERE